MGSDGGNMGSIAALAILGGLLGLFSTIFWMYVGWRAMVAHEKLATATKSMADRAGDRG